MSLCIFYDLKKKKKNLGYQYAPYPSQAAPGLSLTTDMSPSGLDESGKYSYFPHPSPVTGSTSHHHPLTSYIYSPQPQIAVAPQVCNKI